LPPINNIAPPTWWIFGQCITWLIILIGWIVVDKQNNSRELRREIRALIDSLITEVDKLASDAIDFHKKESFDVIEAKQIRLRIQRIANNINRNSLIDDAQEVYLFRRSITGNNFDQSSFSQQTDSSIVLKAILEEKDELISSIEDKYCKKYRK
jgi:hypothetical protein